MGAGSGLSAVASPAPTTAPKIPAQPRCAASRRRKSPALLETMPCGHATPALQHVRHAGHRADMVQMLAGQGRVKRSRACSQRSPNITGKSFPAMKRGPVRGYRDGPQWMAERVEDGIQCRGDAGPAIDQGVVPVIQQDRGAAVRHPDGHPHWPSPHWPSPHWPSPHWPSPHWPSLHWPSLGAAVDQVPSTSTPRGGPSPLLPDRRSRRRPPAAAIVPARRRWRTRAASRRRKSWACCRRADQCSLSSGRHHLHRSGRPATPPPARPKQRRRAITVQRHAAEANSPPWRPSP